MEITAIKERLSLSEVLKHYSLEPKNNMLKCFMHNDQTASLQVNLEKNFYKCHACGKSGDVIQFIEDYEKLSKHEAIKKAQSLISSEIPTSKKTNSVLMNEKERIQFLEKVYLSFRKGIFNCVPAKDYVKSRALQVEDLEIGFNSGQLHYAERKGGEKGLIQKLIEIGLLSLAGTNSRTGGQAYKTFGIKSIVFPLKNKSGEIVSFYFRSIVNDASTSSAQVQAKHFYLKNRSGIYPGYPKKETKKLILTEAIIDAASLLQIKNIVRKGCHTELVEVIACFGTNGLNGEILNAIKELPELEEIIFCFDQDKAGKEATKKYAKLLSTDNQQLTTSFVELPNNDINETLQLHSEEIFTKLLQERKFLFQMEKK